MDNPIRLYWLDPHDPDQPFPSPHNALKSPNGLLAIGGDLSPARLLRAYAVGVFPWFNPNEPILWWCPDPRAVLEPDGFHISRSFSRRLRKQDFAITLDRAFDTVIKTCAEPRREDHGTWLGSDMQRAYRQLFDAGFCHSVEVWQHGQLIGGLYGLALGRIFFGESMFSRQTDGSKVALYALSQQLKAWSFDLIDCQVASDHLRRLGAQEIPRATFLRRLNQSLEHPGRTGHWRYDLPQPNARQHLPVFS